MNYHNITKDDMLNGPGLRVVLWVAGCEHHCKNCHNPITWDPDGGIHFDNAAYEELMAILELDYISGITFSGGDPLHSKNRLKIAKLCHDIKERFPNKTIWIYTGYKYEDLKDTQLEILKYCDVLVDGPYIEEQRDITLPFRGSKNQNIIYIKG